MDQLRDGNEKYIETLRAEGNYSNEVIQMLEQSIDPPEIPVKDIPTLEPGVVRPASEMLLIRFEYAGRWTNATHCHSWLSITEMRQIWTDADASTQIGIRQQYWEESPVATMPWDRLSLFGWHREQHEEIYLVWPVEQGPEPMVLSFIGNYQEEFTDLGDFVLYHTQPKI